MMKLKVHDKKILCLVLLVFSMTVSDDGLSHLTIFVNAFCMYFNDRQKMERERERDGKEKNEIAMNAT